MPVSRYWQCRIIAFEFGLIKFLSHLCHAIARLIGYAPADMVTGDQEGAGATFLQILSADSQAVKEFASIMVTYLSTGCVLYGVGTGNDRSLYERALRLRVSTERWCMGHEYGHLLKGHLGEHRVVHIPECRSYEEASTSYDQELDADTFGITFAMAGTASQLDPERSGGYVGAEIFCLMDLLINRSIAIIQGRPPGEWTSKTHPRPENRIRYMRERLQLILGAAGRTGDLTPALEFADKATAALWALQAGWETMLQTQLLGRIELAPQFANR